MKKFSILAALCVLLTSSAAFGAAYVWSAGDSFPDWDSTANWNPSSDFPGSDSADTARIDNSYSPGFYPELYIDLVLTSLTMRDGSFGTPVTIFVDDVTIPTHEPVLTVSIFSVQDAGSGSYIEKYGDDAIAVDVSDSGYFEVVGGAEDDVTLRVVEGSMVTVP